RFAPVASVGKRLLRALAVHFLAVLQHRLELLYVVCVSSDVLSDDDLRVAVHHCLAVVTLFPAGAGFERLTRWICRVCLRVLRKLHLLRRCGLPATLLSSHFFLFLFSLADLLGLFLFELLFLGVESVLGFPQSVQSILLLPEFLRELVSTLFRTVFVIFGFVDLGGLVEDVVDFVGDMFTSAILVECGVALDAPAVQGDFTHLSHASFPTEAKNLNEEVFELLAMVLAEEADRAEVRVLIRGEVAKSDVTFEETVEFAGT